MQFPMVGHLYNLGVYIYTGHFYIAVAGCYYGGREADIAKPHETSLHLYYYYNECMRLCL
jgi:hypothetical protein